MDILTRVEEQIKTMNTSLQKCTQLTESTFKTISDHTSKLNEHDTAIILSSINVASLAKEVEGVHRNMCNLENSKLDRQTGTN